MTDELPAPPQNLAAEKALLGACLASRNAYNVALAMLADEDFYHPAHRAVWVLMRKLAGAGSVIDPITVMAAVGTESEEVRRQITHTLVADLYGSFQSVGSVGHYGQLIADSGLRRRIIEAAQRAVQSAYELEDPADAAERAVTDMTVARNTQLTADATDVDVYELLSEPTPNDDFIIPGLLARGDRLILTATEGLGKSTLLRQLAVTAAAGLHPFYPRNIDPVKVLVVDCENSRKLSRDRYRPLLVQADQWSGMVEDRLRLDIRPSGLNLLTPGDAGMLLRMVERVNPDLMLIGPIYRLHEDDPNDERVARKVAAVLDRARAVNGCAIITEAHTPHTDGPGQSPMRPVGSSLWKRWPEFGYCLKLTPDSDFAARQCRLIPWRGPRDERDWPLGLRAGGDWPWSPITPSVLAAAS